MCFPETSFAQTTAADDWSEQWPLAIPKAVGKIHLTTLGQYIEEGAVSSGIKSAVNLGKRRYSESSAGHGIIILCVILYLCHFCLLNKFKVQLYVLHVFKNITFSSKVIGWLLASYHVVSSL